MHITHIELHNFGKHADLKLELSDGLVGIFGPNGSGKSTITDAVYAAITGDFGRFAGVKADCIRVSAPEDEDAFVRVRFEHNDVGYDITRYLRPNKQVLLVDGETKLTRTPDIQAALEQGLGIDNKLMANYVFVPQWSMFDFLSQTPGERAAAYQTLCGTGKAQEIYEAIDKEVLQDTAYTATVIDDLDSLREAAAQDRIRIEAFEAEIASKSGYLLTDSAITKLQKRISDHATYNMLSTSYRRAQQQYDGLKARKATADAARDALQQACKDVQADVDALAQGCDDARQHVQAWQLYEQYVARRNTLQQQVQDCEQRLAAIPSVPEATIPDSNLVVQATLARDMLAKYKSIVAQFEAGKAVECPTCLTPSTQVCEHIKTAIKPSIATHTARLAEVEQKHKEQAAAWQAWQQYQRQRQPLELALTNAKARVSTLEPVPQPQEDNRIEMQLVLDEHVAAVRQLRDAETRLQAARLQCTAVDTEMRTVDAEIRRLNNEIAPVAYASKPEDAKGASQVLEDNQTRQVQLASLQASLQAVQAAYNQRQADIARKQELIARSAKSHRFVEHMRAIRDMVFQRQQLPRRVAHVNLKQIESAINRVLDSFGNPFIVSPTEDLSFNVRFPGEPPQRAERLSGGQKGVLAVAFRIAVASLFGAEIGLMILDEPTAGMDDANVNSLASALSAYAARLKGSKQIIMITHSPELKPSFNQVIDLANLSR